MFAFHIKLGKLNLTVNNTYYIVSKVYKNKLQFNLNHKLGLEMELNILVNQNNLPFLRIEYYWKNL